MSDATDIARACFDAYVRKDRAAIEAILAPDFHFTSPYDNRIDRRTYFARCWPNSERITGYTYINLTQHGEQVFVTYEGRGLSERLFRNTEIMTIRDGKIVDVEVYFGWSVPHDAPQGGFIDSAKDPT